ncbi:MAG TPA: S-methyl-5-thioribose-1-phosphate isomerase [Candidatus Polarisedimenticolia bacterium]|nr:S-methyl-5-thioribose-1-phosphate isomerase [Candidatus Polarisedimenticolia bacterium]
MFKTIEWGDGGVLLLDQRRLPEEEIYLTLTQPEEVAAAIRDMAIRGAPAIGVAAAFGIALGFQASVRGKGCDDPAERFESLARLLGATRPTAVNLFWGIERMRRRFESHRHEGPAALAAALLHEARGIHREDIEACRSMGRHGAALLPDEGNVLTHCNAGALATAGYGTALGVIRAAVEAGKRVAVYADETRPWLQGARLTAWELHKDGIPVTVLCDGMAGHLFQKKAIGACVVGADRIARNGDVANKIGTYQVAVLARAHGVPFYVAAPTSTVDLNIATGASIPIEERPAAEAAVFAGRRVVPEGVPVLHPAFDVTPHALVTAIVTEHGIARDPYGPALEALCAAAGNTAGGPRPAGAPGTGPRSS